MKRIFNKKVLIHVSIAFVLVIILTYGTMVMIDISTNHGQAFSVPDFKGLSEKQAKIIAKNRDIKILVTDSVYEGFGKRGAIISQNPPPDFKIKENRTIFVTIISKKPQMLEVPNFISMTHIELKSKIINSGFRIGNISYKPGYKNKVLEQRYKGNKIKRGDTLPKGSKIDFVLGRKNNLAVMQTPDLLGETVETAEILISEKMLNVGAIIYDETIINYQDSLRARVVKQRPTPKTAIREANLVDIWVSVLPDSIQ